jgi:hypothetical protein
MQAKGKTRISLKLSVEQQEQIQQAIGRKAAALELTAEELEARIAPLLVVIADKASPKL